MHVVSLEGRKFPGPQGASRRFGVNGPRLADSRSADLAPRSLPRIRAQEASLCSLQSRLPSMCVVFVIYVYMYIHY